MPRKSKRPPRINLEALQQAASNSLKTFAETHIIPQMSNRERAIHYMTYAPFLRERMSKWGSILIPSARTVVFQDEQGMVFLPFELTEGFARYDATIITTVKEGDWEENVNYTRGTHALCSLRDNAEYMKALDMETRVRLQEFLKYDTNMARGPESTLVKSAAGTDIR
jgi:hypothetical protein